MNAVFTIGHSNRTFEDFVLLLSTFNVHAIVDVRSSPTSRKHPQFDGSFLSQVLTEYQISYFHLEVLGGHRPKNKTADPATNALWKNQSFHNYADYAMTNDFRTGLEALIQVAQRTSTAIMCSEAVWWRCHRRIIADYLLFCGIGVEHILSRTRLQAAQSTPGARPSGEVICYPSSSRELPI